MALSLKDIAVLSKVSIATVSRVINHKAKGNMRQETYERVMSIIKETGYTPHALASGLRKGLSKVVGIILPDNVNPYYAQLGKAIENECFKYGYMTFICNTNSDVEREKDYIRHLCGQCVSGILLCSTGLTGDELKLLVKRKMHIILLDEDLDGYKGDVIIGDDFKGGYEGARYLYGLGHRKILVINGPESWDSSRNRLKGFIKYTEELGLTIDNNYISTGNYLLEPAYKIVKNKLSSGTFFTAIFAFNDLMAIGAIKALNENNIQVPMDISVLGYDNIFVDVLFNPNITTVATPVIELGKIAVQQLLKKSGEDFNETERILLEPSLIIRDSCAAPKRFINK